MKRKTYKNVIENKNYITLALAEMMYTTPFSEIKVTDVCKKAGVSKNTFYRHFTGLSDVIYQTVNEINEKLLAEIKTVTPVDYKVIICMICNAWYENRAIFRGFTQSEVMYIVQGFFRKSTVSYFDFSNMNSDYTDFFSDFVSAVLSAFLCRYCKNNFSMPPEKLANLIYRYMCGNAFDIVESVQQS